MGRPLIDRVSDPVRRQMLTSLFYAPSLGALALAGGLVPAAVATGMFTTFAVYSYLRLKIEMRDLKALREAMPSPEEQGMRRSAPVKIQEECDALSRKFGMAQSPRVYVYPKEETPAFATSDNEIGFSEKALSRLRRKEERQWVIAHELAHIEKGDTQVNHAMYRISFFMEAAAAGIGGMSALQLATGNTSVMLGGVAGLTSAFAANRVRRYLVAYDSRSMERRRDYEATQKTGDLIAAIGAVEKVERLKRNGSMPLRERWLHTHPVGVARIDNLVTAYTDGLRSGVIVPKTAEAAPRKAAAAIKPQI